ncbi:MAG TPA: ThuA domain-containing protein [bacterium]
MTADGDFKALVFSKTAGFRHDSIPAGIAAIKKLGDENGFATHATEDAVIFKSDSLAKFAVVVFLNTSGDILDSAQKAALQTYISNGGGFVGIHSASDTEYNWPWYGELVGAYFQNHPQIQTATVVVNDSSHVSTAHLPSQWTRTDEWYNFRTHPSDRVQVLLRVDENTYSGGSMGAAHPVAWYHEFDDGRAWYTAMGHTKESYSETLFLQHLLGGIQWAAGR